MIALLRALNGMLGIVPALAWLALLVAALLHGCAIGLQRDRAKSQLQTLQASTAQAETARAKVALEANSNFRKFEHQQAASAAELEYANQKRKAAVATVDRSNRDDVDGLRRDVDRLNATARGVGLPSAAACPGELAASRRAAENARGLLAACTAEYQDLASSAQRDAVDLGTGVGYADLVHAAAP